MAQSTDATRKPAGGFASQQSARRTLVELGAVAVFLLMLLLSGHAAIGCVAEQAAKKLPASVDQHIGEISAQSIRAQHGLGRTPTEAQSKRVERLFAELTDRLIDDEKELLKNARVTLLIDSDVNAFALPGGEVFVLSGLLERAGSQGTDLQADDILRGVLAHELGHAVKRHGVRGLARRASYAVAVSLLMGNVDQTVIVLTAGASELGTLSHSRAMENEADAFGAALLERCGYDTSGLVAFLESLEAAPLPQWLSTHPDPAGRAAILRARSTKK